MIDSEVRMLVVEDDEVDQELVCRAIVRAGLDIALDFVSDGLDALEMLKRSYRDKLAAGGIVLVLLDLNLPKLKGVPLLEAIRADEGLRGASVIVWSTSARAAERSRCAELGVVSYHTKKEVSDDVSVLVEAIRACATAGARRAQLQRCGMSASE